jgi:hypothetical protein
MEDQGFTILERAISDAFADEVRAAIKGRRPAGTGRVDELDALPGPSVRADHAQPARDDPDRRLAGPRRAAGVECGDHPRPGPGLFDIHTDYTDVPEPYPDFAMSGVSVWAFEDWTEAVGPTWIVPGSHRMRRAPRRGEGLDAGVPVEMPKGSVVFFTQGVWHWQGHRTEPGERVSLHPHFNRGILRAVEMKRPDVQLLAATRRAWARCWARTTGSTR